MIAWHANRTRESSPVIRGIALIGRLAESGKVNGAPVRRWGTALSLGAKGEPGEISNVTNVW